MRLGWLQMVEGYKCGLRGLENRTSWWRGEKDNRTILCFLFFLCFRYRFNHSHWFFLLHVFVVFFVFVWLLPSNKNNINTGGSDKKISSGARNTWPHECQCPIVPSTSRNAFDRGDDGSTPWNRVLIPALVFRHPTIKRGLPGRQVGTPVEHSDILW